MTLKPFTQVGEVVLKVGSANGWGPVGMTRERMDVCLERAKKVAEQHNAEVILNP